VIGHTSSFSIGGKPEEEGRKKKPMPLREVGVLKLTPRQAKLRTIVLKTRPDRPVQPVRPWTGGVIGLINILDRSCYQTGENWKNSLKTGKPTVYWADRISGKSTILYINKMKFALGKDW